MVGDRSFDMLAARELNLRAIGVTWGFGTREELTEAGADELVDDADELARALLARAPTT
jgi:phosphoglycolate phosphatase